MGFLHVAVGPLTAFQQRVPPERDNYPHTAVIPSCAAQPACNRRARRTA
jgi:hypothetical protein